MAKPPFFRAAWVLFISFILIAFTVLVIGSALFFLSPLVIPGLVMMGLGTLFLLALSIHYNFYQPRWKVTPFFRRVDESEPVDQLIPLVLQPQNQRNQERGSRGSSEDIRLLPDDQPQRPLVRPHNQRDQEEDESEESRSLRDNHETSSKGWDLPDCPVMVRQQVETALKKYQSGADQLFTLKVYMFTQEEDQLIQSLILPADQGGNNTREHIEKVKKLIKEEFAERHDILVGWLRRAFPFEKIFIRGHSDNIEPKVLFKPKRFPMFEQLEPEEPFITLDVSVSKHLSKAYTVFSKVEKGQSNFMIKLRKLNGEPVSISEFSVSEDNSKSLGF